MDTSRSLPLAAGLTLLAAVAVAAGLPSPPVEIEVLQRSVETGSREEALTLAREVVLQEPPDEQRIRAVMYSLARRGAGDREELDIYRHVVGRFAAPRTTGSTWEIASTNWAATFRKVHGPSVVASAAQRLREPTTSEIDAALYLLAIGGELGRGSDPRDRQVGLDAYRPYLESSSGLLQESALRVAYRIWDYETLSIVKQLAFEGHSVQARSRAYALWMRFAAYGPSWGSASHSLRDEMEARRNPHDPAEVAEWNASFSAYQTGIRSMVELHEDPRGAMPPRPSIDLQANPISAAEPAGEPTTASRPPMDRTEQPSTPAPLPASSTTERRPAPAPDASQERPMRPSP